MSNTTQIETSITLCDTDITIRQAFIGIPSMMWGAMRYCHPVTIIVTDAFPETFDYYGNTKDYAAHKDILSESDLIDAMECIISDAIAGTCDCAEFFNEFGYEDPCEGLKAWKGCTRTRERLVAMGITEDMFYDVLNELGGGV